jgi:hypothetical protein
MLSRQLVNRSTFKNGNNRIVSAALGYDFQNYSVDLQQQKRTFVSKALYRWAQGLMPKISKTEQIALGCGTIGFDRDIFTGSPSLKKIVDTYKPKMSQEEQAFLDNEVSVLCSLLNDHEVVVNKDFSLEAWEYMREKKFFGMYTIFFVYSYHHII